MFQGVIKIALFLKVAEGINFTPEIPKGCLNQTFCEEVPNYPHQHVKRLIEVLMKQGFQWPSLPETNLHTQSVQDSEYVYIDICPSVTKLISPQAAKDQTGKWRFILNRKENPMQRIQMEICLYNNKPCGTGIDENLLSLRDYAGYTSRCEQKMLKLLLAGLDERGNVTTISTNVAICCSCTVYHTYY